MYNPFSLEGKTILITGASSGIGAQCAIDCSKMGAKVVLLARNEERLQNTLKSMEGEGHSIISFDLNNLSLIPNIVDEIVTTIGPLDGVLHCAGISTTTPLKLVKEEMLEKYFRTNVFSAILLTKEICRMKNHKKEGASIVFLSSVAACNGESAKSTYSMTKGSLISGMRSLACEYGTKRIRFNCISPGIVITPINKNQPYLEDPDLRAKYEKKHILGFGQPTDISQACIFLLSDAAKWITGQNIIVDGGYTAI